MNHINVVIKTLFCGVFDDEMNDTVDIFWSEYHAFKNNNGPFNGDDFIYSSKDIIQGNSHIWNQKYYLTFTTVLGFVACGSTSKILGVMLGPLNMSRYHISAEMYQR